MRRRLRRSLWPRGRLSGCPVGDPLTDSPRPVLISGGSCTALPVSDLCGPSSNRAPPGKLLAAAKIARELFDPRLSRLDVRVVGAEDPLLVGQQRGEQLQCAAGVPGLPGPGGDVAAGGQGVGVVGAEDPLLVGQQRGGQVQCAAGVPGPPGPGGDVAAGGQGVGWSGPRTRCRSGSSAVNNSSAPRASPACPVQ